MFYRRLMPTFFKMTDHPWLQNAKHAPEVPLGDAVRVRLKQFSAMNKLKKKALHVIFITMNDIHTCMCASVYPCMHAYVTSIHPSMHACIHKYIADGTHGSINN